MALVPHRLGQAPTPPSPLHVLPNPRHPVPLARPWPQQSPESLQSSVTGPLSTRPHGSTVPCTYQSQRPLSGPSGTRPPSSSDLVLQQIGRANSIEEILLLVERHGAKAAASFVHVELLTALARCLGPGQGLAAKRPAKRHDIERVQALLPGVLRDLTARLGLLSFKQLAAVVQSLAVLVPALRLQLPSNTAAALAAALPAAASNATSPPPYAALAEAFTAARQLCIGVSGGGGGLPPAAAQQMQEYLRGVVTAGPDCPGRLRREELAGLAAVLALVERFGLPQPPSFVQTVTARVDELVAAACPAAAATSHSRDEASRKGVRRDAAAPTDAPAAELDVRSLALLLLRWCAAPPLIQSASVDAQAGGDWVDWLSRVAEAVWLTQDPATQERRHQLTSEVAELMERLAAQLQEAERLQRAEEWQRREAEQRRGGRDTRNTVVGSRGGGRDGGRGGRAGTNASGRGAKPAARETGRGAGGTDGRKDSPAAPAAGGDSGLAMTSAAVPVSAAAAAIAANETAAELDCALAALGSLGPAPSEDAAASVESRLLVELAFAVGNRVGEAATRRGCEMAELALRSRLGEMADQPRHVVLALAALSRMRHTPSRDTVYAALQALQPRLQSLPPSDALALLAALESFVQGPPEVPPPAAVLEPLATSVGNAAAAGTAPTQLLVLLLRACAAWGVRLPEAALAGVARAVERRVRLDVNPVLMPELWQSLEASTRFMVESSPLLTEAQPSPASTASGGFLGDLLDCFVLPLASLGQAFPESEVFMVALHRWKGAGFPGLEPGRAAALLRVVGAKRGWVHPPMMRRDLEALLVASLREESLLAWDVDAGALAELLAAAAGALRVMSGKVLRRGGIAEDAAPLAAPLLLPAAEWLLALRPGAEPLATAAHALFVELEWAAATGAGAASSASQQQQPLLVRLLGLTEPSLAARECTAKAIAHLLAACARCGHTPPPRQLATLYGAGLEALRSGPAPAAVLVSLASSVGQLGGGSTDDAAADSPSAGAEAVAVASAREGLLQAVAVSLTQSDAALAKLSAAPSQLVGAMWQVAQLRVALPPAWLASYSRLLLGLLPRLQPAGLAAGAAGLALLGAQPEPAWVDALLSNAEERVTPRQGAGPNWSRFGTQELGLLLGAAHALRAGGSAAGGAAPAPLSKASQQAWSRAHTTFVRESLGTLPRYRPAELPLVVTAVAAFELDRKFVGGSGAGRGAGKGADGAKGSLTSTDFMGRVEPEWLEACGAALLEARRRRVQAAVTAASEAGGLPAPELLLALLRLASRVVADRADGSIARLADTGCEAAGADGSGAAGAAEKVGHLERVLDYYRLSLSDWAAASQNAESGDASLPAADWAVLLRAALDAGLKPSPAELEAYCSGLFSSLSEAAGRQGASDAQLRALWAAIESALERVLLPVLPWAPPEATAEAFQRGFLGRAPLQGASMRQLGLLCTYCAQTGLGTEGLWDRVRQELLRRLPPATVADAGTNTQSDGRKAAKAHAAPASAGGGGSRPSKQQQPHASGAIPDTAIAASDLAAVLYALELAGFGTCEAAWHWLRHVEETTAGRHPQNASSWMADSPALAALPTLQRVWALYRSVTAGAAMQLNLTAFSNPAALGLLLPPQLVQLVTLCAHVTQEGELPLPADVAAALLQRLAGPKARAVLTPAVAAMSLLHILPIASPAPAAWTGGVGGSRSALPPYAVALAQAAEAALPELPLDDVAALLGLLEGRRGWRLSQQRLEGLVARLEAALTPGQETCSPERALQMARALLALGPVNDATGATGALPLEALRAVAPLLQRVLPDAEGFLVVRAVPERCATRVKAAGAAAANDWRCKDREPGLAAVCHAALSATDAMAAAVIALAGQSLGTATRAWRSGDGDISVAGTQAAPDAETAGSGSPAPARHEEAAGLLFALIDAGGKRSLPRSLAAIALWLLALPGVVRGLPQSCLEQAINYSLVGHEGLPMCDQTAAAIRARLEPAAPTLFRRLAIARQLRLCGASAVLSHEVLEELTIRSGSAEGLEGLGRALDEMDKTGMQYIGTGGGDAGEFFKAAVCAMWMADNMLASDRTLTGALHALQTAERVAPRMYFNKAWGPGSNAAARQVADGGQFRYASNVLPPLRANGGGQAVDRALLWRFLDLLGTLGPATVTEIAYSLAALQSHSYLFGSDIILHEESEDLETWHTAALDCLISIVRCSPYLLDSEEAASLARGLAPDVQAHAAAVAAGGTGLLTSRQLGLLYGLTAMRKGLLVHGYEEELQRHRDQVLPLYLASLDALLARADAMSPLERLTAAADALEPVVCVDINSVAVPPDYSAQLMPRLQPFLAQLLATVLVSNEPAYPPGVDPDGDFWALTCAQRNTEESLLASLYRYRPPSGTRGLLPLPEPLRPPPGTRHGFGDPAGDAAREAYVREVAPWYRVVKRLRMLNGALLAAGVSGLKERLAERGVTAPGSGRWAQLVWEKVVRSHLGAGDTSEQAEAQVFWPVEVPESQM